MLGLLVILSLSLSLRLSLSLSSQGHLLIEGVMIIIDFLKSYHFQKYGICWVFSHFVFVFVFVFAFVFVIVITGAPVKSTCHDHS